MQRSSDSIANLAAALAKAQGELVATLLSSDWPLRCAPRYPNVNPATW
jgi:hypothetical protein